MSTATTAFSLPPVRGLCGLLSLLVFLQTDFARADASFVRAGEAGFVVSYIEYGLSGDAAETGACPQGMSLNLAQIYALTAAGKRRADEPEEAYLDRLQAAAKQQGTSPDGKDLCLHPEAGEPDPYHYTVQGSTVPVYGIDLDGEVSADDFPGMDGTAGVDNQWYRVVGCGHSWQPTGQSNSFNIGMLTGSWGILVKLKGVDDIRNDDHVEVGLYANADPIRLSPSRAPVSFATYAAEADPRYRATTTGSIKDGVLTTAPVDARFRSEVNSMYLERPLRDARLQVTLSEEGVLTGYLSGYTPVEAMYDMQFGFRNGRTAAGDLAPLRLRSGSANGAAFVLGRTCHGAWQALHKHADGHRDAETGAYTSISTQYRISAIPAFVVEREAVNGPAQAAIAEGSGDD